MGLVLVARLGLRNRRFGEGWIAARGAPGQGIVEYGLILSLMAVVTLAILLFFGNDLAKVLAAIGAAIDRSD